MTRIGVIGAGAYGTALACVTRRGGNEVILWAREPEAAAAIMYDAENPLFLKGVLLPPGIVAINDLSLAAAADMLLLAPPAQHMRAVTRQLRPILVLGRAGGDMLEQYRTRHLCADVAGARRDAAAGAHRGAVGTIVCRGHCR